MSANQIMKGKVGDKFEVAKNYDGKWANGVGVPQQTPRGPAVPIPPGDGPKNTGIVERPDFRKVDKNGPVWGK